MNTIQATDQYTMKAFGRIPLVEAQGHNCTCTDENGKTYIDFGSGIGCNVLGWCNDAWTDAVCNQVKKLQHACNYYYTQPQAELAEKLAKATGFSRMFFGNSGAEANECAIKVARKYSSDKYGKERGTIISLVNSFHGRTIATLAATGQDVFHQYFYPFPTGHVFAKANDIDDLKSKLDGTVAGIMIELIQGEGGVCALDPDYVKAVKQICDDNDIILIIDEVQTGCGRTGAFLAQQLYGIQANVTTMAKAIGGGLPIGICLVDEKCENVITPGTHGSTFGGNPVVCAGAVAVLDTIMADGFLDSVKEKAAYLRGELEKIPEIESLSGIGMMIGMTLKTKDAHDVMLAANDAGLLVLTAKEKLRLLPPLTITKEEMDAGLAILRSVLA
ncbi:MAG: acetylornithine/succinylornithine family transaminase [Oscillospiraceae bacterium]|nr:acetylornithine/succinylornithine family transaminase [Oscillospiraceae bacterium]